MSETAVEDLDQARQRRTVPDDEIYLPSDHRKMVKKALDLIEICRTSASIRAAWARQVNAIVETGRQDGTRALISKLYSHIDRLASHLFSPVDLRFSVEFENPYPKKILQQGQEVARRLSLEWKGKGSDIGTDMEFAAGVFESLKYGATLLKQWPDLDAEGCLVHNHSLVMPWQFGVYREDLNGLTRQPAFCETTLMSMPEVWKRICHMPDAKELFSRIKTHMRKGAAADEPSSFFHQVLSTSTLNTGNIGMARPVPGGIVQLNNDANYAIMGPDVAAELVRMHELWVWDNDDYVTVQIVEPDILVAPRYKKINALLPGAKSKLQPYTLIQPNIQKGYFWGRSETQDLMELQGMLAVIAADTQRLYGLQVDKILSFSGFDGLTDERYDQYRQAGYFPMPPGASVNDITPKFPAEAIPLMNLVMQIMDMIGGFDNILSGKGEQGVRAGVHAETLLKTASPRLRDRSLLVERQLAEAADLWLSIMEAKDARTYWTDPDHIDQTSFKLHELPEDRQVTVDSHSGSPIFQDNHQQIVAFGLKAGIVTPHMAIELLPLPQKDLLQSELREKEKQQAELMKQLMQRDPMALEKILTHQRTGSHHT